MGGRSARNTAMDLLARRDHSRKQLKDKLVVRGFEEIEIESALNQLQKDRLIDDDRFAENYIQQRMNKGFGPLRIRHELDEHGVCMDRIGPLLDACDDHWAELMREQRSKKYGPQLPDEYRERMKQARFLQNRGFSPESVMRLFRR